MAVVGLNFGSVFVEIYQNHPDVESVALCDPNRDVLNEVADRHGVKERFTSLDDLLKADICDAVHLFSPVPFHVEQTLAVLESGRHCACAVPMATTLEDIRRIIAAQKTSGKNYMMMETVVYSREFLYAKSLLESGDLGEITFLRGTYYQDVEGAFPKYWRATPPMHYATHAVAPLLALAKTRAAKVCCFGSGRLRADLQQPGGNIFPLETAIFQLADSNIAAEVTRSWFQTARAYTEAFSVYGDKMGYEWQQLEHEEPVIYTLQPADPTKRGREVTAKRVQPPDRPDLLPKEIARFTDCWHGGSHPHLAHEFIRSIVEGRKPWIDTITAADWTAPGICAHLSAMQEGEPVMVPDWRQI
jgi:predicted dehydrogenase